MLAESICVRVTVLHAAGCSLSEEATNEGTFCLLCGYTCPPACVALVALNLKYVVARKRSIHPIAGGHTKSDTLAEHYCLKKERANLIRSLIYYNRREQPFFIIVASDRKLVERCKRVRRPKNICSKEWENVFLNLFKTRYRTVTVDKPNSSVPRVRTKVALGRQGGKQHQRISTTTAIHGVAVDQVSPPVQVDLLPLDGKEDDDAGEGQTAVETSGQDVVVLFPPGRLVALEVPHEGEADVQSAGQVRHVVWCPEHHAVDEERRVNVLEPRNRAEDESVDTSKQGRRQHRLRGRADLRAHALTSPPSQSEQESDQEAVL